MSSNQRRRAASTHLVPPQVVALLLDQVEGVKEDALVSALVTDEIERGNAVVIAGDSLPIDDARARAEACQRLNDQREAVGEVVARTAVEPHLRASLPGNDAEAVVLNLVQPLAARWQFVGFGREAGRNEPGWEGTLQHVGI